MASAAQNPLPVLYNQLEPISSNAHANFRLNPQEALPSVASLHAIPLTADEFLMAQRHYPIVFTSGEGAVPLALMGLNEGVNLFVDEAGRFKTDSYIPAYLRRYPFILVKLQPDSDELSLCFDPTSGVLAEEGEGDMLFTDGQPSEMIKSVLGFCEQFEQAGARTASLIAELEKLELLIDGEVAIQPEGASQPFVYRGFRMVSEDKLKELRGDVARKLIQSGAMALIYAHLMSLSLVRDLFARQASEGKGPAANMEDVPQNTADAEAGA